MIRINLSKRKKGQSTKSGFTLASLTNGKDISSAFTSFFKKGESSGDGKKFDINGPIPKIVISLAIIWFIDDYIATEKKKMLDINHAKVEKLNIEKADLNSKLTQVKGYEILKQQLETDEVSIRVKLQTVNKLLENRNSSSKMLMQLAQSIPEEVWLTDLKVTDTTMKLSGSTVNYNQVSDFIKNLNTTSQFSDIGLSGIQESSSAANDQKFQNFELNAKRRNGG